MQRDTAAPLILVIATVCVMFALYRTRTPDPIPDTAPAQEFSAGRAMKLIAEISAEPHPMGTREHEKVRSLLISKLTQLGLAPETQTETVAWKWWGIYRAGTAVNIIARLPGTSSTGAILLVGHYDTVPNAPGANDNTSAVAAILETLRALKAGAPLRNDVICLLTDGEEIGVYGAQAFAKKHPLAGRISAVIHFDSSGTGGPVALYETTPDNRWLLSAMATSARSPVGSSLLEDVINNTPQSVGDFTLLKRAGMNGLNFGSSKGNVFYHTAYDDIRHIDAGSVQQMGGYALGLSRYLGNLDLQNKTRGNDVYFDLLGWILIHYPVGWVLPHFALVLLLFIWNARRLMKRKALTFRAWIGGIVTSLSCLALVPSFVAGIWWCILKLHPEYSAIPQGDTYNSSTYYFSFLFLSAGFFTSLAIVVKKRISVLGLYWGVLFCWMALAAVAGFCFPGSSFAFLWPLTVLLLTSSFIERLESEKLTLITACLSCAGFASAVFLIVPFLCLGLWNFGMQSTALLTAPETLLLGLFVPQLGLISRKKPIVLPVGLMVIGFVLILMAGRSSSFDHEHPKPAKTMFYALNADTGVAFWAAEDGATDEWTSLFLPPTSKAQSLNDFFPLDDSQYRVSRAPHAPLQAPEAIVVEDTVQAGKRRVKLNIRSARLAPIMNVYVTSETKVLESNLNGVRLESADLFRKEAGGTARVWCLAYNAPPVAGITLLLTTAAGKPLHLLVTDRTLQLPAIPELPARPTFMIPAPSYGGTFYPNSDSTIVARTFTF